MKKTFKVTIEINTDSPKAEEWTKINDYVETEIEDALSMLEIEFIKIVIIQRCGLERRLKLV